MIDGKKGIKRGKNRSWKERFTHKKIGNKVIPDDYKGNITALVDEAKRDRNAVRMDPKNKSGKKVAKNNKIMSLEDFIKYLSKVKGPKGAQR